MIRASLEHSDKDEMHRDQTTSPSPRNEARPETSSPLHRCSQILTSPGRRKLGSHLDSRIVRTDMCWGHRGSTGHQVPSDKLAQYSTAAP